MNLHPFRIHLPFIPPIRWCLRSPFRSLKCLTYVNLSSSHKGFLDVLASNEVSKQPMLHILFNSDHTNLKFIFYVEVFLDFSVCSAMFFMTCSYFLLDLFNLFKLFLNIGEVMVHLDVLKECESIVVSCWHGSNLKYLFVWSLINLHI